MPTIQVNLSPDAKKVLASTASGRNRAGVALRDWVIRRFESSFTPHALHAPLFATTIKVEKDVPLILEALAHVTGETQDALIETWACEQDASAPPHLTEEQSASHPVVLSDDSRARVIELVDLAETLFEETILGAHRQRGSYPEGEQAAATATEIYRALRSLLGITGAK